MMSFSCGILFFSILSIEYGYYMCSIETALLEDYKYIYEGDPCSHWNDFTWDSAVGSVRLTVMIQYIYMLVLL